MRRVREDLAPIFANGDVHELMALMPGGGVLDLRTDNLEKALDFVQRQDAAGAIGLYVGNNPLSERCGGPDRKRPNNQSVVARCNLFLDLDRAETSKHLATHDDLGTIHRARQYVQDFLTSRGFPAEASRSGVTGNGEYLIYQTDHLPVDAETNTLIKRAVRALKTIVEAQYPTVKLDTVADAVRVRRISGTINRKHDAHRMCLLDVRDQKPATREMLEALAALAPVEERIPSNESISLSLDDQDIIERLQRKEKYRDLLSGDKSGYADYSSARYALAGKLYFEHADEEQIERIIRSSGLFKDADDDRQRDHSARFDARKRVSEGGPQRNPNYGSAPYLSLVTTPAPSIGTDPDITNGGDVQAELAAARADLALAHAFILKQGETIGILRDRLRRKEEQVEVYKNTKLGASRMTGAVLGDVLQEMTPREPNGSTPYRLPLDRLADRTNQSADTCSRQLKGLAKYTGPDGLPLVVVETRDIPRRVDKTTGEILGPTKEIWAGITCKPSELTHILGSLEPDNAPKHGGAADRNVCPDHPAAGVIRRTRTTTRTTHECAHCRKVLDIETVAGPSTRTHLSRIGGKPIPHHADREDEWEPAPFAHRPHEDTFPVPHDADSNEMGDSAPMAHHAAQEAPANLDPPSNPQHAPTTDKHTSLIRNMRDRVPPPVSDREPTPAYIPQAFSMETATHDASARAAFYRGEPA